MNDLVTDQPELVARWVLSQIRDNVNLSPEYNAIGVQKNGELQGGVIYHCYRKSDVMADIDMVTAGRPGWLNRGRLNKLFYYPYVDLGCTRTTLLISKKNKRSRRFAERLGYSLEGCVRQAMQDGKDAMIYGMLKSECRWI